MSIKIKKKINESTGVFVRRFAQEVQTSGLIKEFKKRMHREKPQTRRSMKISALNRVKRQEENNKLKRTGKV